MKNTLIKLAVAVAASAALLQSVTATSITGSITFSGAAVLNTTSAGTAASVTSWLPSVVNTASGTFASSSVPPIVTGTTPVTLNSPWSFNTATTLLNFWQVGGFSFDLSGSSVLSRIQDPSTGYWYLSVAIAGTVTGNGFDATAFTGSFQVSDPSSTINNAVGFSTRLSFAPAPTTVPDGGTTVMILGATLSGLALIRRKLVA